MRKFTHLWNNMPEKERARLMPYMIESHILHIEQCKLKAIRAHEALLKDFNQQIKNCNDHLLRLSKEAKEGEE